MRKKALALLMSLVLAIGMCVPAFGMSGTNNDDGSITINNAVVGQEYSIYQILALESYSDDAPEQPGDGAYAYTIVEKWDDFINSSDIKGKYVAISSGYENQYVTWIEGADAAAFAKAALKYAKEQKIDPVETQTASSETVKFEDLNLGYYLVDSTLGTICSLDTTNPAVTIKEKNGVPENEKKVKEDSTGNYGKTNDADIGQTVEFQSTITAQAGAENYVFHDKMSAGLTFGSVTNITLNGTAVDAACYEVKTLDLADGCTFEVEFTQTFCDTLKTGDKIVISYTATVNENAVVGQKGNPNDSWLTYGDSSNIKETTKSETITYTWDMDVLKYANGDESKVLADAQFVLLSKDKTKVATVVNGKLAGWADVPVAGKDGAITWPANTELTSGENGKIEIDGLDADTYYLREVKAPAGYNVLKDDVEVEITGATKGEGDTLTYSTVVAKVENKSGTELPSTGGIGTTLFYVVGGVLVVGAAVLLIMRRRAGSEE